MFQNMSIKARLVWSFGVLAAFVLVVTGLALYELHGSNERFEDYIHGINARAMMAQNVRAAVSRRAIAVRNIVLVTKPEDLEHEKAIVIQSSSEVRERLDKLVVLAQAPGVSEEVKHKIDVIGDIEKVYGPIATDIYQLALDGKHEAAIAKMNDDCRPHLEAMITAVDDYMSLTKGREDGLLKSAANAYNEQGLILLTVCVLTFVVAIGTGYALVRSLSLALGAEPAALNDAAQKVAQGDLSSLHGAKSAPVGSVLANLGAMQASLADVVAQVRQACDLIATGSAQIATGSADLSQRTEEQASNLQQTAASMEQMNTTVRASADTAQQANQLASTACASATHGGTMVQKVVTTMEEITQSSHKIADIIGIIDSIAFQTNILALNAAVEAARAGEQGRGFAVVAGEVRNLARRSAEAAREIKDLISTSVDRVQTGSRLVDDAGAAMTDIVNQIKRVTDLIGEISTATVEHTRGIDQVSSAVSQLDQVTQQNASLVEESAAASETLRHQAQRLTEAVSVFKLDHQPCDPASVADQPRAPTVKKPPAKATAAKKAPAQLPRISSPQIEPQAVAIEHETGDWGTF